MLAKSEGAVLTVTVLGTLTAWLAGPHPSQVRPIYDGPSIACSVPASALRASGRLSAKSKHCSIKSLGCSMRFHDFREWNRRRRRVGAAFVKPTLVGALVVSGSLERLFIERPYVTRKHSNRTSQTVFRQIG